MEVWLARRTGKAGRAVFWLTKPLRKLPHLPTAVVMGNPSSLLMEIFIWPPLWRMQGSLL